jgi:plastocyanin
MTRAKNMFGVAIALVVVVVGVGSVFSMMASRKDTAVKGDTSQITATTDAPEVIPDPNVIEFDGESFKPSRLTVTTRVPVTIVNSSKDELAIDSYLAAPGGIEMPKVLPSGGTITHTFNRTGEFEYFSSKKQTLNVFIEVTN